MDRAKFAYLAFVGGTGLNVWEIIKGANIILGLVGSVLMVAGGYYALRLKKREWEDKNR